MGFVARLMGSGRQPPAAATPGDTADGALDTLASVLRTFGDPAFGIDDGLDPDAFRGLCDALACHVENGARVDALDIPQNASGERAWGRVRRFFIDRRRAECAFVDGRLSGYRGIVEDLVGGLRELGRRDGETESCVTGNLKAVEAAVETGRLDEIRATLNRSVQNVADSFARQKREYERQIAELNRRMSGMRDDLVTAREQMKRDALTGTYNRGAFDTALVHNLNLNFILGQPVTVVFADLDHFKAVNDRHGHAAGDGVLRAVGDCLSRTFIRKSDVVARYGGDEFAVILADTSAADSVALLERFFRTLGKERLPGIDGAALSCSVGYTEIAPGDSVESVVMRADAALYEAKEAGRSCYRYAPPPVAGAVALG